ncbi:MAG TPA: ATP-binding protein [Actinomycetota bacterium]|nr:ATP-binding protein [Actinomycetota bacterium]
MTDRDAASTGPAPTTRSRRTLGRGVLVFRWVALAWMTAMAALEAGSFRPEWLAWTSIGVAAAWTVYLSAPARRWGAWVLYADVALCAWLLVASGIVVPDGAILSQRPFFATGYPLSAALQWAVVAGPVGGVASAAVLSVALVVSRPANGVALSELGAHDVQSLAGAVVNYLVAGAAVGLVSSLLRQSADEVERATRALVRERERSARLSERESLARRIHDSVLQALALVHKRGRELGTAESVPGAEVARLAAVAGDQERELRALILRPLEDPPEGTASLRESLEQVARAAPGVGVSAVGPLWLDAACVEELTAAVRQALHNAAEHARASSVTVFAEEDDGWVTVSVRDDGVGFVYDPGDLAARGKAGVLKSIVGRVEDLGGRATIATAPGRGTEIEMRVPAKRETQW